MFSTHQSTTWRLWLARIVLLAVACRGLIPLGYMPEAPSHAHALPGLAICGGHMPVKDHGTTKSHDAPCPFSVNAAFAVTPIDIGTTPLAYIFLVLMGMAAFTLLTAHRYANASSRSPPSFS